MAPAWEDELLLMILQAGQVRQRGQVGLCGMQLRSGQQRGGMAQRWGAGRGLRGRRVLPLCSTAARPRLTGSAAA